MYDKIVLYYVMVLVLILFELTIHILLYLNCMFHDFDSIKFFTCYHFHGLNVFLSEIKEGLCASIARNSLLDTNCLYRFSYLYRVWYHLRL